MAYELWEAGKLDWNDFPRLSLNDLMDQIDIMRAYADARRRMSERKG